MPSTLTWLDYSENDRRVALDVISRFGERDTRDDLGLGTVRDALSDLLSPGTTTIQTRARYFLFVPWVYQRLEGRRAPSAKVAERLRWEEQRVLDGLLKSDDLEGVIGREAGRSLKRFPSNIYWAGLGSWGIRLFQGTQRQYHRSLDRFYERLGSHQVLKEDPEGTPPPRPNWHPHLPPPPEGFPDQAELRLREVEARYLGERIQERAPETLLAHVVSECGLWEPVEFAWEHPEAASFPSRIRTQLHHARLFSETMLGAALLYNLLLARAIDESKWEADYTEKFAVWAEKTAGQVGELRSWPREELWAMVREVNPRLPGSTEAFVSRWIDLVIEAGEGAEALAGSRPAESLIRRREWFLKRGRARLRNRRQLELWQGASGAGQLDFRWGITQRLVLDIIRPLAEGEDDAASA